MKPRTVLIGCAQLFHLVDEMALDMVFANRGAWKLAEGRMLCIVWPQSYWLLGARPVGFISCWIYRAPSRPD